jgi:RNA polymerase sigma-70 factor, ECF subfamily
MIASRDTSLDAVVADAVRAVLAGNNDAFALIVRQYQSAVMTLATVILRDQQAAAEVTQDVFVLAWQRLKSFNLDRPIKPWLLGIAHHIASDCLRKRAIRARKEAAYVQHAGSTAATAQPLDALIADERSRILWKMIDSLPRGEQLAAILFYREGLSVEQVAESLGVSSGTVKTSLFRARKHLYKLMQESPIS